MNAKSLAKHYDRLTPRERLSLIMAAEVRGDEIERDRLTQSAPQVAHYGPHHFALALAVQSISNQRYMELLDMAASFVQGFSTILNAISDDAVLNKSKEYATILLGLSRDLLMIGFAIKTLRAGWRLFCEKRQIPADAHWEPLPGYATICQAEKLAELIAYSEEEWAAVALRYYTASGAEGSASVIDAEHVAAGMERCLQDLLKNLGG